MSQQSLLHRIKFLYAIVFSFLSMQANASHCFGGQITWECLSNGQYQFEARVYINCDNGQFTQLGSIDVFGHPTVCYIQFNLALSQVNDLSPTNCGIACNSGAGSGAVREYVYRTNPVTLPGTPPPSGWVFYVYDSFIISSLNHNGQIPAAIIKSVMYPGATSSNPCYDSSPFFIEKPINYFCIGQNTSISHNAFDADNDSLAYEWENLIDPSSSSPNCSTLVTPISPYAPAPYSLQNPFPGHPLLNTTNGNVSFNVPSSFATIGGFSTCIKVTSYRQSVKLSEVYRTWGFYLVNNCLVQGTAPNNINLPPNASMPFSNITSNDTTIIACDTIRFNLTTTDIQANLPPGGSQTITLSATGVALSNPTNSSFGCNNPPCAELNKALPATATFVNSVSFSWPTEADLLDTVPVCNGTPFKTYYFVFKATDNFCPTPASAYSTIGITITRPPVTQLNSSVWVSSRNALSYQWYLNCTPIAGATDSLYNFTSNGSYSCLIQTKNGCPLFSQWKYLVYTGISDTNEELSFSITPNPASNKFTLQITSATSKNTTVTFTDVLGRTMHSQSVFLKTSTNTIFFDIKKLSPGVYFVKVDGKNKTLRMVVEGYK